MPWESANGQKRHDRQHNANNAARQQVLAEQTADALDDGYVIPYSGRDFVEEAGEDSIYNGEFGPGVLFNGQPAPYYDTYDEENYEDYPEPHDFCAVLRAENHLLRQDNALLQARVDFLEAKHGYR